MIIFSLFSSFIFVMTLTFLKSTGQLFCRVSLNLSLLDVISWLRLRLYILEQENQRYVGIRSGALRVQLLVTLTLVQVGFSGLLNRNITILLLQREMLCNYANVFLFFLKVFNVTHFYLYAIKYILQWWYYAHDTIEVLPRVDRTAVTIYWASSTGWFVSR